MSPVCRSEAQISINRPCSRTARPRLMRTEGLIWLRMLGCSVVPTATVPGTATGHGE